MIEEMESPKKKMKWCNQTFETEWLDDPEFKDWPDQDRHCRSQLLH
jgi:hypothetical protein